MHLLPQCQNFSHPLPPLSLQSRFNILPMPPVLQMYLKGLNARPWARIIQFARTVQTPNPREVFEADVFLGGEVGGGRVRRVGDGVDRGAAHRAFEAGVWVLVCEGEEGG